MTLWTGVAVAYVLTIAIGVSVGRFLAERHSRGDGGLRTPTPAPEPAAPQPAGPAHALDACPPLGSAFDRALLPTAFDDQALGAV